MEGLSGGTHSERCSSSKEPIRKRGCWLIYNITQVYTRLL